MFGAYTRILPRIGGRFLGSQLLLSKNDPKFLLQCCRYSHYDSNAKSKMTIPQLYLKAKNQVPITCVTTHDSISARLADNAGTDMILVGDSLSMVAMGLENTQEIELDDMIYHTRAVCRGNKSAFVVADLPFGSYETSVEHATESAIKMVKKGGAEMLKFEGGRELVPTVKHLSSFGIPTMPHIGLTPQRQVATGGFKVQGRTAQSAFKILQDALELENAGATMILLEGVPAPVAKYITSRLNIPTIGIGAGPGTSGQVLVQLDMLGGFDTFVPKFLKKYSNYLEINVKAIKTYNDEVRSGQFPAEAHCYTIKDDQYGEFLKLAEKI